MVETAPTRGFGLKVKAGSKSVVGARASSIAATKSGSSSMSSALMFSAICSGRLAPMMALLTFSFCSTQASATEAGLYPASRHSRAYSCTGVSTSSRRSQLISPPSTPVAREP